MHTSITALILLLISTLAVNVPLGIARENVPKFSLLWFFYIHISIPFIIAARLFLGFGWIYIPLTLGCAVTGQIIGGRIARKRQA